ncbi:MAG: hypothetical protein WCJ13_00375 [Coriobacteriia bacterium]
MKHSPTASVIIRIAKLACAALLLASLTFSLTACDHDQAGRQVGCRAGTAATRAQVSSSAAREDEAVKEELEAKARREAEETAKVMKYEEGATDTLVGEWYWPNGEVDFRDEHRMNPVWTPIEGDAAWHFVIVRKGEGYATDGGGAVKLDGKHFTVSEKVGSRGDTVSFTGGIVGDTLVGTVNYVVVAKANTGEGVFDIPWTATRVK